MVWVSVEGSLWVTNEQSRPKASVDRNASSSAAEPVLLYDGACGFCNNAVQTILRFDRRGTLRFAALYSDFARAIIQRHPSTGAVDSMVFVDNPGQLDEHVSVFFDRRRCCAWRSVLAAPGSCCSWLARSRSSCAIGSTSGSPVFDPGSSGSTTPARCRQRRCVLVSSTASGVPTRRRRTKARRRHVYRAAPSDARATNATPGSTRG